MALTQTTYRTQIAAPRERVWDILWGETTYPQWTAAFDPDSHVHTDWQQGSTARFTSSSGDGMIARIQETRRPAYLAFEHIGQIRNGVEDYDSLDVQAWKGAIEAYRLDAISPTETHLIVQMDISDDYRSFFDETWPQALALVKQLAEAA